MNENVISIRFGDIEQSVSTPVASFTDEQMRAIARLKGEAKTHGFGEGDYNDYGDLRFEPWLVAKGALPLDYSTNIAKVGMNPSAEYAAIVEPAFCTSSYFMVFAMTPQFEHGETWRYRIRIKYIGRAGSREVDQIVFDSCDHCQDAMVLMVSPDMDEYEVSLECGLPVDFLRPDIQEAIRGLMCLLALRAEEVADARILAETASLWDAP